MTPPDPESLTISSYRSLIGLDRNVKWSHMFFEGSESTFIENPEKDPCCILLGIKNGTCDHCPSKNVLINQIPDEAELLGHDGRWWHISAYPAFDNKGDFSGVIKIGKNITEIRQSFLNIAEESLLESERRLSTLMSNLPGMAYRCKNDKDWTMEFVSQGCHSLTGYLPEEIVDNKTLSFNDLISPCYREQVWNDWQQAISERRQYTGEYQIITAGAGLKWVWEKGQAIYNSKGEIIALEGFIQDITDQMKAEIALTDSEEKYRTLIESALVGIYSTKLNGDIIIVNDALSRMLEYDLDEELKALQNVITVYKDKADRDTMIDCLLHSGKITNYEQIWRTRHGREIVVIISAVLSGDIISGMVMDITQRKKMELQLIEQKERAEQSDKLKVSFLANISHELRTPLDGIIGFADILLGHDISTGDKEHYSKLIRNLSGQLLSIVNDMLEISKIENNQVSISNTQINVKQMLNKLFHNFENQARTKNLSLILDCKLADTHDTIYGDDVRLVQVLTHLLKNALKFTYSGSISFGCTAKDGMIRFYVRDTGIGILPENQDIIFERFRQVEDTNTRKFGGSGLGLAISKALVEMMGGEIYVESDMVEGSTFIFTIPHKVVPPRQKIIRNHMETKSCLNDCRILICEDDDFGYLLINRMLTQAGASTFRAATGNKAIKFCQSDVDLDLIIMDLRLPEMSGSDAAELIKKIKPSVPIIVCTASSGEEIESVLSQRIFDDVVYKPIINKNLLETICKML